MNDPNPSFRHKKSYFSKLFIFSINCHLDQNYSYNPTAPLPSAVQPYPPENGQGPYMTPTQQGPYTVPTQQSPYMAPTQQGPYTVPTQQGV